MTTELFIDYLKENYPDVLQEIEVFYKDKIKDQNLKDAKKEESKLPQKEIDLLMSEREKLLKEQETLRSKLNELVNKFQVFIEDSKKEEVKVKHNTIKSVAKEIIALFGTIEIAKRSCSDPNILIGIDMLEKQFLKILNKFNIFKKEIQIGDKFDEKFCEAVEEEPNAKDQSPNTISKILSYPFVFKINDEETLIQAGKVAVIL